MSVMSQLKMSCWRVLQSHYGTCTVCQVLQRAFGMKFLDVQTCTSHDRCNVAVLHITMSMLVYAEHAGLRLGLRLNMHMCTCVIRLGIHPQDHHPSPRPSCHPSHHPSPVPAPLPALRLLAQELPAMTHSPAHQVLHAIRYAATIAAAVAIVAVTVVKPQCSIGPVGVATGHP